jgi:hypothetical protein
MQQKTLKTFEKYWSAEKSDGVNHVDRKPDAIFRKRRRSVWPREPDGSQASEPGPVEFDDERRM